MSANDIAGAVAWPVTFVVLIAIARTAYRDREHGIASLFAISSCGALLAAVFCVARLCGAQA